LREQPSILSDGKSVINYGFIGLLNWKKRHHKVVVVESTRWSYPGNM